MRLPLPFLLSLLVLAGCASEKRLGEAKFQPRRYSRGVYVQQHSSPKADKHQAPVTAVEGAAGMRAQDDALNQPETWAALDAGGANAEVAAPRSWLSDSKALVRPPRAGERPLSMASVPIRSIPSGDHSRVLLLDEEPLPEPINGYHPNAVPGFVLSLGWFMGWVAAISLSPLSPQLASLALFFGCLASIVGHFLTKRAYRLSLRHPELYPRYKLPKAARIVSLLWVYISLVYLAAVLVFFVLFSIY